MKRRNTNKPLSRLFLHSEDGILTLLVCAMMTAAMLLSIYLIRAKSDLNVPENAVAHEEFLLDPEDAAAHEEFLFDPETGFFRPKDEKGNFLRRERSYCSFSRSFDISGITEDDVRKALGIPKYNHDEYFETHQPGVIPGLAWTSAGGELLYIEALLSNGTGTLNITGNLGKVMKESAEIAINYLCANEDALGISHRMFKEFDLSLHFPEGAVPKDGPSAGITIFTALASLYTQRPVKPQIAMTGELTLTGRVLAVGGIKEKILGAKRAGIKRIVMSEQNRRDIEEINPLYIEGLEFHYVKTAMELIPLVLEDKQVDHPIKVKARTSKKKGDNKGNA